MQEKIHEIQLAHDCSGLSFPLWTAHVFQRWDAETSWKGMERIEAPDHIPNSSTDASGRDLWVAAAPQLWRLRQRRQISARKSATTWAITLTSWNLTRPTSTRPSLRHILYVALSPLDLDCCLLSFLSPFFSPLHCHPHLPSIRTDSGHSGNSRSQFVDRAQAQPRNKGLRQSDRGHLQTRG